MALFARTTSRWSAFHRSVLKSRFVLWNYSTNSNTTESAVQVTKNNDAGLDEVAPSELVSSQN